MVTLSDVIRSEQMSLFLGEGYVLTFVEDPGDVFDPVRQRIRSASGKFMLDRRRICRTRCSMP